MRKTLPLEAPPFPDASEFRPPINGGIEGGTGAGGWGRRKSPLCPLCLPALCDPRTHTRTNSHPSTSNPRYPNPIAPQQEKSLCPLCLCGESSLRPRCTRWQNPHPAPQRWGKKPLNPLPTLAVLALLGGKNPFVGEGFGVRGPIREHLATPPRPTHATLLLTATEPSDPSCCIPCNPTQPARLDSKLPLCRKNIFRGNNNPATASRADLT